MNGDGMVVAVRRTVRKKTRSSARFRAPVLDSLGEDDEGDETEMRARFDLLPVA